MSLHLKKKTFIHTEKKYIFEIKNVIYGSTLQIISQEWRYYRRHCKDNIQFHHKMHYHALHALHRNVRHKKIISRFKLHSKIEIVFFLSTASSMKFILQIIVTASNLYV